MNYEKTLDAIKTIIAEDSEGMAIKLLSDSLSKKLEKTEEKRAEYRSCLVAIKKINKARFKDEGIDGLSEVD